MMHEQRADLGEVEENSMTYPITEIAGLDAGEVEALKTLGIRTTDRLLEEARTPRGRRELRQKTSIDEKRLLNWANTCDKLRIKGMGKGYAVLLSEAGVETVRELRYRSPENLVKKMVEVNRRKRLVGFLPPPKLVQRWVDQAKKLPLKISYKD
jgi:hypothetical protein